VRRATKIHTRDTTKYAISTAIFPKYDCGPVTETDVEGYEDRSPAVYSRQCDTYIHVTRVAEFFLEIPARAWFRSWFRYPFCESRPSKGVNLAGGRLCAKGVPVHVS